MNAEQTQREADIKALWETDFNEASFIKASPSNLALMCVQVSRKPTGVALRDSNFLYEKTNYHIYSRME